MYTSGNQIPVPVFQKNLYMSLGAHPIARTLANLILREYTL